jgi:ABC-2 type transport system permease protein
MLRLIKAEIFVLFKTRTFKVLCVISILLGLMLVGLSKLISSEDFIKSSLQSMPPEQQEQFIKSLQSANDENASIVQASGSMGFHISAKDIFNPTVKELFFSAFGSGAMEILMAVLIGAMVASEYSSGTIKNILAYGKKREYYYIAKLVACTLGFTIMLGLMVTVATVGCSFMFQWGEPFTITQLVQMVEVFAGTIVIGMGISSVLMLIATLVKSNGTTIGIGIVAMSVLPSMITLLYGKYDWFDRIYESTLSYNWTLITSIRSDSSDILRAVLVAFITLVIATLGGITVFKKQDIR